MGSEVWFQSWTDLSQSDFLFLVSLELVELLVLLLLYLLIKDFDLWDSFSSSSSWSSWENVLFNGINSSKTGTSLDVCSSSEHSVDCALRLYSVVVPDNCCLYVSIAAHEKKKQKKN